MPAQLDVFEVDREFMLHLDPLHYPDATKRSSMKLLESFSHVQQKLTKADFLALHGLDGGLAGAPVAGTAGADVPVKNAKEASGSFWSRFGRRVHTKTQR